MLRFRNGVPESIWLSQHSNGEAYTYACLEKPADGKRVRFVPCAPFPAKSSILGDRENVY